ncbi:hypothetical protein [Sphingomonas sp. S2-65]|uniref:hypothetical protein n=1 Tax=Sphingomonas sp. S2-65 TaxID=2903960 RepID=UPI001F159618|nr:hypothetical protein [Sphingomonas sp. S2-65]UYY58344.1 hypothetical protein LZ586_17080 [Sphingomonas sp. S2-65]
MRVPACLLPALLLGAAPPQTLPTVPLGAFQTWGVHPKEPLSFVAGGATVEVAATPCEQPTQNEACRFDGVSNQAIVTVRQRGLPPFRMTSDSQASFVRVAVVRLAPEQEYLGVVVDNQWGGSGGIAAVTVIEPIGGGYRAVPLEHHGRRELTGEVAMVPRNLLKDGRSGFVLEAPGFNYSKECNACVPRPPLVLTIRAGRSVDISADPTFRPLFAQDLRAHRRVCMSKTVERNGNCAAYVADAARLGQAASAWRVMLSHYRRDPAGYPAALRAFLVAQGYITPASARSLPLS